MPDIIMGRIQSVLEPGVYKILVTHIVNDNVFIYNQREMIAVMNDYTLSTAITVVDGELVELDDGSDESLIGRHVTCYINYRDVLGRLNCDIKNFIEPEPIIN